MYKLQCLKVLFKHCLEMKIFPNSTWKELPNTTIYTFSLQFPRTKIRIKFIFSFFRKFVTTTFHFYRYKNSYFVSSFSIRSGQVEFVTSALTSLFFVIKVKIVTSALISLFFRGRSEYRYSQIRQLPRPFFSPPPLPEGIQNIVIAKSVNFRGPRPFFSPPPLPRAFKISLQPNPSTFEAIQNIGIHSQIRRL